MKKLFCIVLIVLVTGTRTFSQDYTLDSTRIHSYGNPGELFLSALLITNNTGSSLTFHLNRIVKNLPANWTSCFCYPTCIAPWIDTLTFSIPPFGTDSIKPNYGTDSIPGIGYITTVLLIQDLEGTFSPVDTIYFTGSTLSTGISDVKSQVSVNVYPNPVSDFLKITFATTAIAKISVANVLGQDIFSGEISDSQDILLHTSEWRSGIYFITVQTGKIISTQKVCKQ